MKTSPNNPKSNRLPSGCSEDSLVTAVQQSGYPLQTVVAQELLKDFGVVEEWGFTDRATKEHRSLDIHAFRNLATSREGLFRTRVSLLVECKRSDLPWIFFKSATVQVPLDFPAVIGFKRDRFDLYRQDGSHREISAAEFLKLHEFSFVAEGPPRANTFAGSERKGKKISLSGTPIFNTVVLPLVSALDHLRDFMRPSQQQTPIFAILVLCICVFDGPMVVVEGPPEAPDLVLSPWVRVRRQENTRDRISYYVVDVVHRSFLPEFINTHLLPFAEAFDNRISSKEQVIANAKGLVSDFNAWQWDELKMVK